MPIPRLESGDRQLIEQDVMELVNLHRAEWASDESSYEFCTHPFVANSSIGLNEAWDICRCLTNDRMERVIQLEQHLNDTLVTALGLQDVVKCHITRKDITLRMPDLREEVQRLLSFAVGCIMGRFSLDSPRPIDTKADNRTEPRRHGAFQADEHGIIPVIELDWGIAGDVASRTVEFIGAVWSNERLEDNIKFIAEALGMNGGGDSRQILRRYLATEFYKHHLSVYHKRPIYWLFTSGKQRAFQCLVYIHRYHEGTLARMRTAYVIPLQGKIAARIEQLDGDKAKATSTSHRNKLQKEQTYLKKQHDELLIFEEKLKHAADQRISLDLDDGVEVNYGKFSNLLAEAEAIAAGKEDE